MVNPLARLRSWLNADDIEAKFTGLIDGHLGYVVVPPLIAGQSAAPITGDANSAVFACLMALSMSFIEPPLRVRKFAPDGERDPLPNHPLQQLLDNPNPWLDNRELWFWIQWAKHCDGNAYVRKIRSGNDLTGNVVELWPISPTRCRPIVYDNAPRGTFISAYRYEYAEGKHEDIPPENIIHFKLGVDDRDMRLGLSPLKRLIRLVASDEEAAKFGNTLLTNFGMPGLIISPDKDTTVDRDQAEELKRRIQANYGGDNRGFTAVLSAGAKAEQFGFSPEQLNLKALHQIPETRICSVLGVPPAVAGVSVGLEQTSNFASFREVREMFTEQKLMPMWMLDASKVNHQLVPDFDARDTIRVAFDLSEVRALQDDINTKIQRLDVAVHGGWLTPNEARQEVGWAPLPGLDAIAAPAPATAPPAALPAPAKSAAERLTEALESKAFHPDALPPLLHALADLAEPAFSAELSALLDAQRRRVRARLVSQ